MKKILVCLSLLALVAGIAFATTCNKCGTEYYGSSCPYCKGYSLGIEDKYNGSNSSKECNDGDYYSKQSRMNDGLLKNKERHESRANCYEGYDDAREGRGPKGSN